ncbi:hypothetical protein HanRHA438_Chr14g0657261 [Helianthus annuus]|nr:hypothetical protein HanIR_Chr14g0701301 [Helianthus annuus]KAJ0853967.1 hypothetical protein HanRHA438_Chr14g0657261 [Helianthus annuus]
MESQAPANRQSSAYRLASFHITQRERESERLDFKQSTVTICSGSITISSSSL